MSVVPPLESLNLLGIPRFRSFDDTTLIRNYTNFLETQFGREFDQRDLAPLRQSQPPVIAMGSDKRTTQPRRQSYHTKSNRMKPVKTPGGKLVLHLVKKCSQGPKCGDTGVQLHGVSCGSSWFLPPRVLMKSPPPI